MNKGCRRDGIEKWLSFVYRGFVDELDVKCEGIEELKIMLEFGLRDWIDGCNI